MIKLHYSINHTKQLPTRGMLLISENILNRQYCLSVIFVNENENENGEKRENNEFVNEN